jgi:mannose-6-phosphate isomerase-like protein (cupin superfamily)
MKPISIANSDHYPWGSGCDGWHLLKDQSLSVIRERMPPGTSEVRHHHLNAQQFFFVLSGETVMEVEGEEVTLHVGEGLHISPRTSHQIRNLSGQPAEFLVISQPPSHGDRIVP